MTDPPRVRSAIARTLAELTSRLAESERRRRLAEQRLHSERARRLELEQELAVARRVRTPVTVLAADERVAQLERRLELMRRAAAELEQVLALTLSRPRPAPSIKSELLHAELVIARRAALRTTTGRSARGPVDPERLAEALARLRAATISPALADEARSVSAPPRRIGRLRRWISAAQSG